jgi:hypothetical protein
MNASRDRAADLSRSMSRRPRRSPARGARVRPLFDAEACARETVQRLASPGGLTARVVVRHAVPGLVDASYSPDGWSVEVRVQRGAEGHLGGLASASWEDEGELKCVFEQLVGAVCIAEFAHWRHCPFDGAHLAVIVAGVLDGLGGLSAVPTETQVRRTAALFCDLVAHACTAAWSSEAHREAFRAGHAVRSLALLKTLNPFPDDVGLLLALEQWTVFRDASDSRARALRWSVHEWFRARSRERPDLRGALRLALRTLRATGDGGETRLRRRFDQANALGERARWRARAGDFARAVAPLLRADSPGLGADVMAFGDAVAARGSRRSPMPASRTGKRTGGNAAALSADLLDLLYRDRADQVGVTHDGVSGASSAGAIVAWLGTRRVDGGVPRSTADLKLSATRMVPAAADDDDLWFYRRTLPVGRPGAGSGQPCPDLAFVVDTSESMTWKPMAPPGQRGSYDVVLGVVYAIWRSLARRGLADLLHYAAVNFSRYTTWSGWHRWGDLAPVRERLFAHQNDRTRLEATVVESLAKTARRQFAALFVTDCGPPRPGGPARGLENPDALIASVRMLSSAGHLPVLIEIGPQASSTAVQLAREGCRCYCIRDVTDLPALALGGLLPLLFPGS